MRGKVGLFAAVVAMLVVTLLAPGSAGATIPLAKSRPFQAVCEAQGGMFQAPSTSQPLLRQTRALHRVHAERAAASDVSSVYGAFFGVQGFIRPDASRARGRSAMSS